MTAALFAFETPSMPVLLTVAGVLLLVVLLATSLPRPNRAGKRRNAEVADNPLAHPMGPTGEDAPAWGTDPGDTAAGPPVLLGAESADTSALAPVEPATATPAEGGNDRAEELGSIHPDARPPVVTASSPEQEPPATSPTSLVRPAHAVLFSEATLAAAIAATRPSTHGDASVEGGGETDRPVGTVHWDDSWYDDRSDATAPVSVDAPEVPGVHGDPAGDLAHVGDDEGHEALCEAPFPPNDLPEASEAPTRRRGFLARLFGRRPATTNDFEPIEAEPVTGTDDTHEDLAAQAPGWDPQLAAPAADGAVEGEVFEGQAAVQDVTPQPDDVSAPAGTDVATPAPLFGPQASTDDDPAVEPVGHADRGAPGDELETSQAPAAAEQSWWARLRNRRAPQTDPAVPLAPVLDPEAAPGDVEEQPAADVATPPSADAPTPTAPPSPEAGVAWIPTLDGAGRIDVESDIDPSDGESTADHDTLEPEEPATPRMSWFARLRARRHTTHDTPEVEATPIFGPAVEAPIDPDSHLGLLDATAPEAAVADQEEPVPAAPEPSVEPTLLVPQADDEAAALAPSQLSMRARLSAKAAARRAKRLGLSDTPEPDEPEVPEDEPDADTEQVTEDEVVFVDPTSWGVATVLADEDEDIDPTSMRGAFQMSRRAEREAERAARRAERDNNTPNDAPKEPARPEHETIDWQALGLPEPVPSPEAVPDRPWA